MCDRDHEPIGTYDGIPIVVCDDVPQSMDGCSIPDVDVMFESSLDLT